MSIGTFESVVSGLVVCALVSGCSTPSGAQPAAAPLQTQPSAAARQELEIFDAKFRATGLQQPGPLKHKRCLKEVACVTSATADFNNGKENNNCGVQSADIVMLTKDVKSITWRLKLDNGRRGDFQFLGTAAGKPDGLKIDDANLNPNEYEQVIGILPPPGDVFVTPTQSAREYTVQISEAGQKLRKGYTFAIRLEYKNLLGNWVPCNPYDPIIVNSGE